MFSKVWIINLLLAVLVGYLGMAAYDVWSRKQETVLDKLISETSPGQPAKRASARKVVPEETYQGVVTKDLFSPTREEFKPGAPPASQQPEAKKDDRKLEAALKLLTLYGVVMTENLKGALIRDMNPTAAQPRGRPEPAKRAQWLKVGDSVQEFKVAEIKQESVVLKAGETEYLLRLYDKEKPKTREAIKKEAGPAVVSVAPTPEPKPVVAPTEGQKPPAQVAPPRPAAQEQAPRPASQPVAQKPAESVDPAKATQQPPRIKGLTPPPGQQ